MAFAENGINAIYRLGVLVYVVIAMMTLFVIIRGIRYHYKRKQQPLVRLVTDLELFFFERTIQQFLVPMGRIELPTSPLPRECSATELHGQIPNN